MYSKQFYFPGQYVLPVHISGAVSIVIQFLLLSHPIPGHPDPPR